MTKLVVQETYSLKLGIIVFRSYKIEEHDFDENEELKLFFLLHTLQNREFYEGKVVLSSYLVT